ncbi:unnamed protein product [Rhodiola kirilowii]
MTSLQGPVICPSVRPKQAGLEFLLLTSFMELDCVGVLGKRSKASFLSYQLHLRRSNTTSVVRCSFSSSSNGNGSKAGKFNENDADYVNSTVLEAGTCCTVF